MLINQEGTGRAAGKGGVVLSKAARKKVLFEKGKTIEIKGSERKSENFRKKRYSKNS